jgi:hypothetical protein
MLGFIEIMVGVFTSEYVIVVLGLSSLMKPGRNSSTGDLLK